MQETKDVKQQLNTYTVFYSLEVVDLVRKVNDAREKWGWVPTGGVSYDPYSGGYFQACTRDPVTAKQYSTTGDLAYQDSVFELLNLKAKKREKDVNVTKKKS